MEATFPSRATARVVLWGAGAPAFVGVALVIATTTSRDLEGLAWFLPGIAGLVTGALAFRMRPDNLVSRRLVVFGAVGLWFNVVGFWMLDRFDADPSWALLGPVAVLVQVLGLAWPPALLGVLAVYPDGRYHRWYEALVVRALVAATLLAPLAMLVARPTIEPPVFFEWTYGGEAGAQSAFPAIASPLHVDGLGWAEPGLRMFFGASFSAVPLLGAALLVLRYRRLREDGRLRLRWPMYGALAGFVLGIEAAVWQVTSLPGSLSSGIEILSLLAISSSVLIGLVRPDLFDIDRAVMRVVVFFPIWLAIAAGCFGLAVLLGLAASGQGLEVAVVVTVVATLAFEPVRRLLAHRAGRWAYGDRVGGEDLVRRLGGTLEHTHDLEELAAAVASTAREGLGVRWVRLRVHGVTTAHDGPPPTTGPVLRADLVHGGETLGEIACGPRAGVLRRSLRPPDAELFETLAQQVALAVHNARLARELAASLAAIRGQASELSASRSRLVAAEETARRRLERDLHDGAQQQLVALTASIALARRQLGRGDPGSVGRTLDALSTEALDALESLRALAAGIHPQVLTDHGLVPALQSRADGAPGAVVVRAAPGLRGRRFAEEVEGTAYFVACEAVTNALKHSGSSEIGVELALVEEALRVEVVDGGRGFDPDRAEGSGLPGLRDRLDAIGGRLAVDSAPGRGTRVTATLPATPPATSPAAPPAGPPPAAERDVPWQPDAEAPLAGRTP